MQSNQGPTVSIHRVSEEEFSRRKAASVRIYAYANRVLGMACRQQQRQDIGYALFDKSGCLLKLYGPSAYLTWCTKHEIKSATLWDAGSIGSNAVSKGLQTLLHTHTIGAENDAVNLQDAEIFFAPLLLEEQAPHKFNVLGGIALLAPSNVPVSEGELICSSRAGHHAPHVYGERAV